MLLMEVEQALSHNNCYSLFNRAVDEALAVYYNDKQVWYGSKQRYY